MSHPTPAPVGLKKAFLKRLHPTPAPVGLKKAFSKRLHPLVSAGLIYLDKSSVEFPLGWAISVISEQGAPIGTLC